MTEQNKTKCSNGDSFKELSKKAALKDHYVCDDELGDEFCTRLKCKLCNGSDINGEPNGYGCEWRDKYLETNEELLVDFDTAYFLQTKKIDVLVKEKADDFKTISELQDDLFKSAEDIFKLEAREKKLIECVNEALKVLDIEPFGVLKEMASAKGRYEWYGHKNNFLIKAKQCLKKLGEA